MKSKSLLLAACVVLAFPLSTGAASAQVESPRPVEKGHSLPGYSYNPYYPYSYFPSYRSSLYAASQEILAGFRVAAGTMLARSSFVPYVPPGDLIVAIRHWPIGPVQLFYGGALILDGKMPGVK